MGRRAGPDVKTDRIIEAIQKSGGNVAAAARALNWNRSALSKRITATPGLREILEDERETVVDIAETQLRKGLHDGAPWAVMYTLNNSPAAKRRGWGPRQEVTGANGDHVQIVIKYADS